MILDVYYLVWIPMFAVKSQYFPVSHNCKKDLESDEEYYEAGPGPWVFDMVMLVVMVVWRWFSDNFMMV